MSLVNKDGWTAFHLSSREGDIHVLRILIEKDSKVWNTVSKNGRTPLHTASLAGHMVILIQLWDGWEGKLFMLWK